MSSKIISAGLALLISAFNVSALPYWRDINATSVNAQTQRTEIIFYSDRGNALQLPFEQSENYLSLNGEWDFLYFDSCRNLPPDIEVLSSDRVWDKIRVPGNWEFQGFGTAIYTNQGYEFSPMNPKPPVLPEDVPVGVYHRTLEMPSDWDGREIYLNLCGAKSGVYVYINGVEVGYCEDSKDLARFDITEYIKSGRNDLVLKMYRWSTGSYLECMDFWRVSGIERDVYLSSEKARMNFDFEIVSILDETYTDGLFKLSMECDIPAEVSYELIDAAGRIVLNGASAIKDGECVFEGCVRGVQKWSAEKPYLYTLIMNVNGEYARFSTGFRRFEITDCKSGDSVGSKVLLVNGKPVKFKGVNLHEHNQYTGHYVSREDLLESLALMRKSNINAIRTCHYPQPRYFYELCDSLGFYVYDEANVESHGMYYDLDKTLGNKPEWYPKHMDRIMNMYKRTRNYPCVTILSLGNEAGNGCNFYKAYTELKNIEKEGMNRPVCYERAEYEWNTDMIVPQYPPADWFRKMGENGSDRPVCPSEYAHAMGNSTGSLDLQWKYIYQYPHLQGGFIWDWIDQGIMEKDEAGRKYWSYGGDYGTNVANDANFLCNGIVGPDKEPHPALAEVRYVYQNVSFTSDDPRTGKFRIHNRFYFTDLKAYTVRYRIEANGKIVRRGRLAFATAPQFDEEFGIRLPRMSSKKTYTIVFEVVTNKPERLVPSGHVIAYDQFILKEAVKKIHTSRKRGLKAVEDDNSITITGPKNLEFVYDKNKSQVVSYRYRGKDVVKSGFGIRPNFWRAPTDNDYGNGLPSRAIKWKEAGESFDAVSVLSVEDNVMVLALHYSLPSGCSLDVVYRIRPDGIVSVDSSFEGSDKDVTEIPRIGFIMRLPGHNDDFRYFGRGPQENYWDRCSGAMLGMYSSKASDEYVPYVRPQECGHHTGCTYLSFAGMSVVADSAFEFNALRSYIGDFDSEEAVEHDYQWDYYDPNEPRDPGAARYILRRRHHVNDVEMRDDIELCLDYRQTGVGGYDSWGARPEESNTLWSDRNYKYSFTIVPSKAMCNRRIMKISFVR